MLFNSYSFIFLFLPVTFAVFSVLAPYSRRSAAAWLTICSFGFYGWWDPRYLGLLGGSILFNFLMGRAIARGNAKGLLAIAIGTNLAILAYFKYANFFVSTAAALTGIDWTIGNIVLPLGISFFTFTQIAFLVDCHRKVAREYDLIHYALFVTWFPHLIAGPVLHHKEMMPQFTAPATFRVTSDNVAVGLSIFFAGLFKKVVLADNVGMYAGPVFAAAEQGDAITFFEGWGGALAYSLQLYFDFSGYSDMAIGASRLFGVTLPLNFNSPYKASDIIDFWRRWHITLSRFLRDYLYFSLGGNRDGPLRRYLNLFLTMVLGGLWHGAGWTFVFWGALHGTYLIINHGWRTLRKALGWTANPWPWRLFARALTLFAVVVGWVFFRAADFDAALRMLEGMAGMNGVVIPAILALRLNLQGLDVAAFGIGSYLGGGAVFVATWGWVTATAVIALFAPNTQEVFYAQKPGLDLGGVRPSRLQWRPNPGWAWILSLMATVCILSLTRVTEFLYFQF